MKRLFIFSKSNFSLLEFFPEYGGLAYYFFSNIELLITALSHKRPDALFCLSSEFNDITNIDNQIPIIISGKLIKDYNNSKLQIHYLPEKFTAQDIFKLFINLNLVEETNQLNKRGKQKKSSKIELEKSQKFLDFLMDNIPDTIYFKDRDSRFTKINHAQAVTLGISSIDDAIGKRDADYFDEIQSKESYEDEQTLMQSGIPLIKKLEHIVTSKGDKYVRATKAPLMDADGNCIGMVGISRDVTNEYQIEKELLREKEFMDLLMNNLPDRIYFKDRNSKFIRCNLALAKMFGLSSPQELYGKTDFDFFEHDHAQEAFDDEQRIMSEGVSMLNKLESYRKNDELIWELTTKIPFFNTKNEVVGIVGISHDFTEQKRLEDKLEKERELLQILMDNVPDYIFFKDTDAKYTRVNKAFADFFKVDVNSIIGKYDSDLIIKNKAKKYYQQDLQVLKNGKELINKVEKLTNEKTWVSITKVPIKDENSNIVGLVGISRDVTMQELVKQRYASAKIKAEEANKAKSLFLANMSHEIRTPMNGIIGMADILSKSALEPLQMEYLDIIIKSGQTLLSLINDILDFSKIESGNMELETVPINIRSIIEEVADIHLVSALAKSVSLFTFVDPDIPEYVSGDYVRLKQIITNLVNNAIKFTSKGEVVIYVNYIENMDGIHKIEFKVKDSGIGISKENQEKLFKSFSQVDASTTRKYGGTGLGLAISKRLVDQMGGVLQLDSSPDVGSTFYFNAFFGITDKVKKNKIIFNKEDLKGKHIVLVDDNETNRLIFKRYLERWDVEVTEFYDGNDAIDFLKEKNTKKVDLVLVDYQMPNISGAEFAKKIKRDTYLRDLKIILLSSVTDVIPHQEMKKIGFETGLNKPIKMNQLLNVILKVFGMEYQQAYLETVENENFRIEYKNKRFLVVDDNLVNIKVAQIVLSELSSHVEVAKNGLDAVNLFKNQEFDIILMDIRMPIMDGIEATLKIRELEEMEGIDSPVKIIAMTANTFQEDLESCMHNGMDAFLEKPFVRKDLVTILQRLL
ncbi:PAS domain-containing hybrid sensor histidine kinase/response regulator [Confluentibacter sediminis]|uniref:PAS domain-containing hybrid sensor histidine kinase/response regulator n=1 Tax=Confluentibacter sediminis TaxID=2219045 RepID=UPI000DAE6D99|nr:PAS domain-containing hybrid sensor histidine kinase/response regulator [Confluentibacter sediminis]